MKIRLSEFNDREGLIFLWNEAFGDSVDSIEFFLNNRFKPQNTVVAEENGKIVSMFYLLDGKVASDSNVFDAYYLYAAATLKSHRGRGIMAKMLDFAKFLASDRNIDLICLKPADDGLYDYYGKYGYKTVFALKTVTVNCGDYAFNHKSSIEKCSDYFEARENAFKDYDRFIWDKNAIDFAVEYHKYFGGNIYENRNGFSLYSQSNGVCNVKEMCFTPKTTKTIISQILKNITVSKIEIDLPVDFPFASEHSVIKHNGMALAVSENGKAVYNFNNIYLNLTLD